MSDDSNPWLCSLAQLYVFARHAADQGLGRDLAVSSVVDGIARGDLLAILARDVPIDWDFEALRDAGQDWRLVAALRRVMDDSEPLSAAPRDGGGLILLRTLIEACMERGHWVW